jgi:hypothetical protein
MASCGCAGKYSAGAVGWRRARQVPGALTRLNLKRNGSLPCFLGFRQHNSAEFIQAAADITNQQESPTVQATSRKSRGYWSGPAAEQCHPFCSGGVWPVIREEGGREGRVGGWEEWMPGEILAEK